MRNFIPGLTKKQSTYVTLGAGAAIGALIYLAWRGRSKLSPSYDWDEDIIVLQGAPFTVKLPRGEYEVVSDDLLEQAQVHLGNETHLVLVATVSDSEVVEIDAVAVDKVSSDSFDLHIEAHPLESFQRRNRQSYHRARLT